MRIAVLALGGLVKIGAARVPGVELA